MLQLLLLNKQPTVSHKLASGSTLLARPKTGVSGKQFLTLKDHQVLEKSRPRPSLG